MENKKRKILLIVGVVLLVILVLIFLYWFFFSRVLHSESPEINQDLNLDESEAPYFDESTEEEGAEPTSVKEYKTSDKLSELTFRRTINGEGLQADFDVVVRGYAQEVESVTGVYGEKVFVLSDASVQWNVEAEETHDETICLYEYTFSGVGEDEVSNLNVPIGQEFGGSPVALDDWGKVELAYSSYGYGSSGKPEISFGGKVLIPVDFVESVTVNRPSENVGAICNGYTESTTLSREGTIDFRFPLVLSNAGAGKTSYGGNAQLKEGTFEESGEARLNNIVIADVGSLTIIPDDNLWEVSWKVYLP
jgi:hypothetical protein